MKSIDPDIIAITGDLIDSKSYDAEVSMQLIREMVKVSCIFCDRKP